MKKELEPCFQEMLQKFFLERMMKQRNASPETIKSYRDTFRLYIQYLMDKSGVIPSKIQMKHLDAEYILKFLDYLEHERRNHTKTLNNRLAAIHSFLQYLSFEAPEYSAIIRKSLLIPFRKEEKRQLDFLTKAEIEALLNVCNTEQELGRRDKLMVLLLYNTGVRVSELISLKRKDVMFDINGTSGYIRIMGKGRKERNIPLWKNTVRYVRQYLNKQASGENDKLFINYAGEELTRSGVRYRIHCLVNEAKSGVPSLNGKNVTPHTFRHSTALSMLQSGIDISTIAIFLGHESIQTTHKYMESDLEMKQKALEKVAEPRSEGFKYKPTADILAFLSTL